MGPSISSSSCNRAFARRAHAIGAPYRTSSTDRSQGSLWWLRRLLARQPTHNLGAFDAGGFEKLELVVPCVASCSVGPQVAQWGLRPPWSCPLPWLCTPCTCPHVASRACGV